MHRVLLSGCVGVLLCAASFGQSGQSLGDVARANRAQQQAQQDAGATPKVITNQDLPVPQPVPQSNSSDSMTMVSGVQKQPDNRAWRQHQGDRPSTGQGQYQGEQWRGRIQQQENRIADLEARIDQMNTWIHSAGGTADSDGAYNPSQRRQMMVLGQMQQRLEQEKQRLAMMQDAARRGGMPSSVVDP
ncbi:MAG TPA: hypothetical protein VMX38_05420 [Verrucomicrobiae bacterium]|jgi:hypothetical protein|nr:hypothetical protein [Verrucomicrobiae bacterium]